MARGLCLEAGTILTIDRGYNDYAWFGKLEHFRKMNIKLAPVLLEKGRHGLAL